MPRFAALFLACCVAAGWGEEAPTPPGETGEPVSIPEPRPIVRIMGKDVSGWIAHLKKYENEQERKLAMFCLIDFGPAAAEAVPELLVLCKDEVQPESQRWAAETLGALGSAAKEAIPELTAILNDQTRTTSHRATACAALAQIDPEATDVRKAILNAFRDSKPEVRSAAVDAAVTLAAFDAAAGAALSKALYSAADAGAAATALRCLGAAGVEALTKAVERGETATRAAAAEALGRMGSEAGPALPALLKAQKKERDPAARAALLLAATRLAPTDPGVLEALVERVASGEGAKARWPGPPGKEGASANEAETRLIAAAGSSALPALRTGLRSRDAAARRQMIGILAKLPAPGEEVVDDLIARVQDKDEAVRLAAVQALDSLGPAAAKAREVLLDAARNDPVLRRAAELAVLNTGRNPQTQKTRYRSVLEAKPDAEAFAALKDANPLIRREAAEMLSRTRTENVGGVASALLEALADPDWQVRTTAARSLAHFGKYARVAMSTFVEWLELSASRSAPPDNDAPPEEQRRYWAEARSALAALAGMGADAKPALPALTKLALSQRPEQDAEVREWLGTVLRLIGPEAVPSLTPALKGPSVEARALAARALASMGAVAATAVPELIELCKSAVDSDAEAGFAALQAIGPPAYEMATPYLVSVLRADLFADRRRRAAWTLGGIRVPEGGDSGKVVDALLLALLDTDDSVCRGAHAALARIGAHALPRLRDMLKLGAGEAPYWAVRVLARMKADPADVIPHLAELTLPDRRAVERGTAVELLGEYAPAHREVIPVLLRALGDREEYVARIATRSLTLFGADVIEPLRKLLQQRNPLVRRRALEALESVRTTLEGRGSAP